MIKCFLVLVIKMIKRPAVTIPISLPVWYLYYVDDFKILEGLTRVHLVHDRSCDELQGRSRKPISGSPQRIELAASEGGTPKNQFKMFTPPMETC